MGALYAALIPAIIAVIGAAASFVVSWLNKKKTENELATIRAAIDGADGNFYVKCPACGAKIYLKSAQIVRESDEGGAK